MADADDDADEGKYEKAATNWQRILYWSWGPQPHGRCQLTSVGDTTSHRWLVDELPMATNQTRAENQDEMWKHQRTDRQGEKSANELANDMRKCRRDSKQRQMLIIKSEVKLAGSKIYRWQTLSTTPQALQLEGAAIVNWSVLGYSHFQPQQPH